MTSIFHCHSILATACTSGCSSQLAAQISRGLILSVMKVCRVQIGRGPFSHVNFVVFYVIIGTFLMEETRHAYNSTFSTHKPTRTHTLTHTHTHTTTHRRYRSMLRLSAAILHVKSSLHDFLWPPNQVGSMLVCIARGHTWTESPIMWACTHRPIKIHLAFDHDSFRET